MFFNDGLGPSGLPDVVALNPTALKGGEHFLQMGEGEVQYFICAHGIELLGMGQVFR